MLVSKHNALTGPIIYLLRPTLPGDQDGQEIRRPGSVNHEPCQACKKAVNYDQFNKTEFIETESFYLSENKIFV